MTVNHGFNYSCHYTLDAIENQHYFDSYTVFVCVQMLNNKWWKSIKSH